MWFLIVIVGVLPLFIATNASAQPANVRCVRSDGNDSFDGTKWADLGGNVGPWKTLSHALWHLNNDDPLEFTEIWMTADTYAPDENDPDGSFQIYKSVRIRGGFVGNETSADQRPSCPDVAGCTLTTLEPNGTNSVRIMRVHSVDWDHFGGPIVLDRIRFAGGQADYFADGGGAVRALGGGPPPGTLPTPPFTESVLRFEKCLFEDNSAWHSGGAIFASALTLEARHCLFRSNVAVGGAPPAPVEPEDSPCDGGGPSILAFDSIGGAIALSSGPLLLVRCTFHHNEAVVFTSEFYFCTVAAGGAVAHWSTTKESWIVNCVFHDNVTDPESEQFGATWGYGGAIFSFAFGFPCHIVNCALARNQASTHGGAIYAETELSVANCTVVDNVAGQVDGAGIALSLLPWAPLVTAGLSNSILWGNAGDGQAPTAASQIAGPTGVTITTSNCCIQGLASPQNGDINEDPRFMNAAAGDYRLRRCSPAVDTGDAELLPADATDVNDSLDGFTDPHPWDLDSTDRVKGGEVDIGAYERGVDGCPADLTGDGVVNGADLALVTGQWSCTDDCTADVNCDGVVNGADLALVIGNWGECPGSMNMMQGGPGGPPGLAALMALFGAETVEALVAELLELDHEVMVKVLEVWLGG